MHDRLFVYGTLLFKQVWQCIVGKEVSNEPAAAPNWARYYVKAKPYPGIKHQLGSSVDGMLITGLNDEDWAKLDAFEDNIYSRQIIELIDNRGVSVCANAYVITNESAIYLSDKVWTPAEFSRLQLDKFVSDLQQRYCSK